MRTFLACVIVCHSMALSASTFLKFHSDSSFQSKKNEREVLLSTILSQPENNRTHRFLMATDANGEPNAIVRRSKEDQARFEMATLYQGEVVLARAGGHNALMLSCVDCTPEQGGILKIRYLYNGISKSYRTLNLKLARQQASWKLLTLKNAKVNHMRVVSRKIFGKLIGISRIELNAKASQL